MKCLGSWLSRRRRAILGAGAALVFAAPALSAPRVISINLCTDQLLVAFADPQQILGLSPYARDDASSWLAAEARRLPIVSGTAEEVLVLKPDFVLSGGFTKRATRELLAAQGVRVVEIEPARSLDEAKAQIREVASLLGQEARGAASLAAIDAAIRWARDMVSGRAEGSGPSVLALQRRGWTEGADTMTASLLSALGLRNAGAGLNDGAGGPATLEAIVALRPDLLLVTSAGGLAEDQGSAMLEHPALRDLYPPEKRIVLPEKYTVCGGPMLAETFDRLSAAIARHRR